MRILTVIPARLGSKGVPRKNFRDFRDGVSLVDLAVDCAAEAGIGPSLVSTDAACYVNDGDAWIMIKRPPELAQDDTPMRAVLQDVLACWTDRVDAVVLLQPTSPLRTAKHITDALALLVDGVSSVVSVSEVPAALSADWQLELNGGMLSHRNRSGMLWPLSSGLAETRQDLPTRYVRDGTVYIFRPECIRSGALYGAHAVPLIIPPEDSISIDTPADWDEAQRRWMQRHGA